jgi:methylphosphotriester-DNA--protein-cysteine methyltransferase
LEKRFRRAVGASPKQFASIVRLRGAIKQYRPGVSLTRLSADAGYYDHAHMARDFRSAIGKTPQDFFRTDDHC